MLHEAVQQFLKAPDICLRRPALLNLKCWINILKSSVRDNSL